MPFDIRQIRSRTRAGRLAPLDRFLLHFEPSLLAKTDDGWQDAVVVDVGFGEHPVTTLEMAQAFRELNTGLVVVGVETDPRRVERARQSADPETRFVEAGPSLQAQLPGPARLVRAMNVLRGYAREEVDPAHRLWAAPLLDGALLVEGSCDAEGSILTAHLIRKAPDALHFEGLLFFTDFRRGFAPWMFRDWLPRKLRRDVRPQTRLHDFFTQWTTCWEEVRGEGVREPTQAFAESVARLALQRPDVAPDGWLTENGYVLLSAEGRGV